MNAAIQCQCGAVIVYQTEMERVLCRCGLVFERWPSLFTRDGIEAKKIMPLKVTTIADAMLGAIATELRERMENLPEVFYIAVSDGPPVEIPSSLKDFKNATSYRMQ